MAFYDNLKLEKGMYNSGNKSFTQVLEELDCSKNYEGTELEGLDAYQRQLKRFDIKVGGRSSDAVEKFFQTSDSAALFPEYVTRAVKQGMEYANLLPSIVATTTTIQSMDYRTITVSPSEDDKELKPCLLYTSHVKRLREKLEGVSDKWALKTVWGVGYKFELKE